MLRITAFLLVTVFSSGAFATSTLPVLRSAVSPQFPDGLHKKYLDYIAEQLHASLDSPVMPFARRLKALEMGQIDIMLGLGEQRGRNPYIQLIHPSYEKVKQALFVAKDHQHTVKDQQSFEKLIIACTRSGAYSLVIQRLPADQKVEVEYVTQKIELLVHNRVDAFIHYAGSAWNKIDELGYKDHIVMADYQPLIEHNFHVAVSKQSPWLAKREAIGKVIEAGLANGDFARIRQQHYADDQ